MGRPKKEQQTPAQGGETTSNVPADGQNTQPQANTLEGQHAKETAAENGGAQGQELQDGAVNPTDVNKKPEPVATQDFLDKNPALVAAGIIAGDTESQGAEKFKKFQDRATAASLNFTGRETSEELEILLADLKAFEELDQDDENEGGEGSEEVLVTGITEEELNKLENEKLVLAGVTANDTPLMIEEKLAAYNLLQENLTGNNEGPQINLANQPNNSPEGNEGEKGKEGDQGSENSQDSEEEPVYHGDFLNESQIYQEGLKLTYDWDEVTAPEHLQMKP